MHGSMSLQKGNGVFFHLVHGLNVDEVHLAVDGRTRDDRDVGGDVVVRHLLDQDDGSGLRRRRLLRGSRCVQFITSVSGSHREVLINLHAVDVVVVVGEGPADSVELLPRCVGHSVMGSMFPQEHRAPFRQLKLAGNLKQGHKRMSD